MRPALLLALLVISLGGPLRAQFSQLWLLGSNNESTSEMEAETGAGDNYYQQSGDYTAVGGINWVLGQEPLNVAANSGELDGFENALTAADPFQNIFFMLTAAQAEPRATLRLTIDFIGLGAGSSHDLEIRLNGTLIRTLSGLTVSRTEVISMSSGQMGARSGANRLTLTRTGGGATNPRIELDYLKLESDPTIRLIGSLTASRTLVRPEQGTTLSWSTDPEATLSISGVGNVDANTINGAGSITVVPVATTTYTLTAIKALRSESASVTITYTEWNQTWIVGTDNSLGDELSDEAGADDDYYFAGDYSGVGGPSQAADEALRDDSAPGVLDGNPAVGFDRALTEADPAGNVWFILPGPRATPVTKFRITFEVLSVAAGSVHDLEFSLNGQVVKSMAGIFAPQVIKFEFTGIVAEPVAGPNVFSFRRTGGTPGSGQWLVLDWLGMEDAAGVMPAVSNVTADAILGTRTVFWTGVIGKTYRVQTSTDNASWITLGQNFPAGGAKVPGLFFEDRESPWAAPAPFYRVLQE